MSMMFKINPWFGEGFKSTSLNAVRLIVPLLLPSLLDSGFRLLFFFSVREEWGKEVLGKSNILLRWLSLLI